MTPRKLLAAEGAGVWPKFHELVEREEKKAARTKIYMLLLTRYAYDILYCVYPAISYV